MMAFSTYVSEKDAYYTIRPTKLASKDFSLAKKQVKMQKPLCAVGVGQTLKCMVCTPIAEECRLIDLVSPYGFAIIVLKTPPES